MITSARHFLLSRWEVVVVGTFLLLYMGLALSASIKKSNTFDEATHVATGYYYWTHDSPKIHCSDGIFSQAWATLPLLAENIHYVPAKENPSTPLASWQQGYDFLYAMGNDPSTILLQTRTMIALLGATLGLLVFGWSKSLFGSKGGLVSLFLFVFCPTMLAHGALATTDIGATMGFIAATLSFWKLSHEASWQNLALSILALGVLFLAKMSSVLIAPIFFLILVVRVLSKRPMQFRLGIDKVISTRPHLLGAGITLLLIQAIAIIGLLWIGYNFDFADTGGPSARARILNSPDFTLWSSVGLKTAVIDAISRSGILPAAYVEGFGSQANNSPGGFLCGSYSPTGNWWFFPFAFLVKTPISTLLLFLFSWIAYARWRRQKPRKNKSPAPGVTPCPSFYDLSPLLILGGVYGCVCILTSLNIGQRHMMPVYPVLFVLAGANVYWLRASRPFYRIGLGVLLLGVALESLSVWPHYLAFFNQFVGGPRHGYRYLVDSSLDWGQDLPGLKQWLDQNAPAGSTDKVYFSYFGTADSDYYGIKAQPLPGRFPVNSAASFPLQGGIYCISATNLQGSEWTTNEESAYEQVRSELTRWEATAGNPTARENLLHEKGETYWNSYFQANEFLQFNRLCAFLRQREPDDEIGYSILIYRVSDEALQQALYGSVPIAPLL